MSDNNKVIQLLDPGTGDPVSPVVNVGSIYDKKGQKIDNLLSYKISGTDVTIPEIKSIEDMLNAKIDAKLTELDAAVSKIEKAAESGSSVKFTVKVKSGESVEKYMPVDVENGECYSLMETSTVVRRKLTGTTLIGYLGNNVLLTCTADSSGVMTFRTEQLNSDGTASVLASSTVTLYGSNSCSYVKGYKISDTVYYVFAQYQTKYRFALKIEIPSSSKISITKYQDDVVNSGPFNSIIRLSDTTFIYSVYYYTYQWVKFDASNNTFTLLTVSGANPILAAGPISETSFLATVNSNGDVRIYDLSGSTISNRGTNNTSLSSSNDSPELSSNSYAVGNGLVLFEYYSSYNSIRGMYLFDCSGTDPVRKSKLMYSSAPTSGSFTFGQCASMLSSDGKILVLHKNLISLKLELSEVSYSGGTLAFSNNIEIIDSAVNSSSEYCNRLVEIDDGFIGACDTSSSGEYYRMLSYNNGLYDEVTPISTEGLALNSASSGEDVEILYSGSVKIEDVSKGYQLDTSKFRAESPVDGILVLTRMNNDYTGQSEIVTRTGNSTNGADNPCTITFSFTPRLVKLIGIYNPASPTYGIAPVLENSYYKEVFTDGLTNEYTNSQGFSPIGASHNTSYAKFDRSTNTLYWYNTSSYADQLNQPNFVYYFLAIK